MTLPIHGTESSLLKAGFSLSNLTITPLNNNCGIIRIGINIYITLTELNVADMFKPNRFAKQNNENKINQ